jgi:ketosteroid isomerase-like protein
VDKDKKNPRSSDEPLRKIDMNEIYRKLQPEMRRPKPSADAIAAALESAQRLAAESDAEQAADDTAQEITGPAIICGLCGHRNREGNKFCGMCGAIVAESSGQSSLSADEERLSSHAFKLPPNPFLDPEPESRPPATRPTGQETHHYHHHYHHHYFPGGEAMAPRYAPDRYAPEMTRADAAREDKMRPTAALRGDMSRAEAGVRSVTQEWVLGCNTKHLDDLLDLYTADAIVLRSNCPPIRGAAALREFFFGALDAGLGEVEIEPLRIDVVGELAYEAGRFKALIPSATGKRREERGKYLWVCARQSNSEWKLAADCWSSDLTLTTLESDVPQSAGVKTSVPRKNP